MGFVLHIAELDVGGGSAEADISGFDVDSDSAKYRAEGNANIALSLLPQKQILRIPKSSSASTVSKLIYVFRYIKAFSKLLGEEFVDRPRCVRIHVEGKDELVEHLAASRPQARQKVHGNSFDIRFGLLTADAVFLANSQQHVSYSIELKPKQGWHLRELPPDARTLLGYECYDESSSGKCRFCAMQYLKLTEQQIESVSGYCPIDLFSEEPKRMEKALRSLADAPQNNLRIFKDGDLVFSEDASFAQFESIASDIFPLERASASKSLIELVISALLHAECDEKNVLRRILALQRLVASTFPAIAEMHANNDIPESDPYEHFCGIYAKLKKSFDRKSNSDLVTSSGLNTVELYELGATALDCSAMITFQTFDEDFDAEKPQNCLTIHGRRLAFSIRVIDLDPKHCLSHFTKFVSKTKKSYVEALTHHKRNKM